MSEDNHEPSITFAFVSQVPEGIANAAKKASEQVLGKARIHRIKLLKLEQCHRCQLHCGSEHLNCAVNPTFLNDSEQETCGHYEEEIITEDPGKWHRPHLGKAPLPTPLGMMVREDDLSVRARLQALGYSIEDLCSDNDSESQSVSPSSFPEVIERMDQAISMAFMLPRSVLAPTVDDLMNARNASPEAIESFVRMVRTWEPTENVDDSYLTEED